MNVLTKRFANTVHVKTEVDVLKLGSSAAEVAFLGRSNVGKSSLINALCQKRNMAQASQVPGKTRTINVYQIIAGYWLVDLPGYGFAVGGPSAKEELGQIIETYLKDRQKLRMIYLVIDIIAGPTKLDFQMINWLKHYSFAFNIVVHKVDKIGPSSLAARKIEIINELAINSEDIFWVSSTKSIGIKDLQNSIGRWLNI